MGAARDSRQPGAVAVGDVSVTTTANGEIELGVTGYTAVLIAQIADAGDLINHEIWQDATPTVTAEAYDFTGFDTIITNSKDILFKITTSEMTAGDIDFYLFWVPLSAGATVVAN